MTLTVGSLFSGIGGMELGLERAGMKVKWQVEIDPWCRKVLAKHWPDVPKYGDIKEIDSLPYVDVLAGGFPCQPVSVAGKRLGQDDERWLWPDFERVIRMVRPRYVLVENVPGLLTRGMPDVLGGLASCGYDAEWQVLSAAAFGAPHLRRRLWIVAYPNSDGRQTPDDWQGRAVRYPHRNSTPSQFQWHQLEPWPDVRHRWAAEPDVPRVDDGLPPGLDYTRGLGNAVVPQVVEYIGQRIIAHAHSEAVAHV